MRILKLRFLKEYKQFKENTEISFTATYDQNFNTHTFLTGKNGSGKTTAMSIIAQLFHNIERYHGRNKFNVELTYILSVENQLKIISISSQDGRTYIGVENEFNNGYLIDEIAYSKIGYRKYLKRKHADKKLIRYKEFKKYLPTSIVASVFSIHGEWPKIRPINYLGDKILDIYDISLIYGNNHYELPSITKGIGRFLELYFKKRSELKVLLDSLGLEFNGRIKINYPLIQNKKWVQISNKNYLKKIQDGYLGKFYINDLELKRGNNIISLDNMSSGEKMLLIRVFSILSSIEKGGVVFIEEPELHLDQLWKRQLISIFNIIFKNYNAHFLIATHSPTLINTVDKENIVFLDNGKVVKMNFNTFLIDEELLFQKMYGKELEYNTTEQEVLDKISSISNKEDLDIFINDLGDSVFRLIALNKLRHINEAGSNK